MHIDSTDTTLKRYLEDIRRTAPLSREEEQILFQKAKEGDKIARKKLISANMRFVLKVAIQYRGCPIPLPDLVSEGAMGLVRAIESFEHTRGLKFISYGVWWIKAYITRAINEQGNLIRLPANQHLRVRKALHEQSRGKEIRQTPRLLTPKFSRTVAHRTRKPIPKSRASKLWPVTSWNSSRNAKPESSPAFSASTRKLRRHCAKWANP